MMGILLLHDPLWRQVSHPAQGAVNGERWRVLCDWLELSVQILNDVCRIEHRADCWDHEGDGGGAGAGRDYDPGVCGVGWRRSLRGGSGESPPPRVVSKWAGDRAGPLHLALGRRRGMTVQAGALDDALEFVTLSF